MISYTSSLKVLSFIYLRPLVEKLRGIKVRVLQNFENFMHHQMNEFESTFRWKNLRNSVVPLRR